MSVLSDNISKVLKEKGLTPYQLSLAAGKNKQFVADLLSGRAKSTSHENLTYLARVLNVAVGQLTGEATESCTAPDLDLMLACFQWVLEKRDYLCDLAPETVTQELRLQFTRMLQDNITDPAEAVRITSYLFDSLVAKAKLELTPPPTTRK